MGLVIEALVAILLAITIGYCVVLNRRLKNLRADEGTLRRTAGELLGASEAAAGAIGGLRRALAEEEARLAARLAEAHAMAEALDGASAEGAEVLRRLQRIASAARPAGVEGRAA